MVWEIVSISLPFFSLFQRCHLPWLYKTRACLYWTILCESQDQGLSKIIRFYIGFDHLLPNWRHAFIMPIHFLSHNSFRHIMIWNFFIIHMLTSIECNKSFRKVHGYALDQSYRHTDIRCYAGCILILSQYIWWLRSHGRHAPTDPLASELVGDDDGAQTEFIRPLSVLFSVFSSFALQNLQFLDSSLLDTAAALTHRAVAASHDNKLESSSDKCGGSLFNAYRRVETNSRRLR